MNRKFYLGAAVLVIIGLVLFGTAVFLQKNFERVENIQRTVPTSPDLPPEIKQTMIQRITVLSMLGVLFLTLGIIALAIGLKKSSVVALLILFLFVTLLPAVKATDGYDRWYASVNLLQPRNSIAVRANIEFERNTLDSFLNCSFDAFRIVVMRMDVYFQLEWIEAGYFQNHSGTWLYGASYMLNEGYRETSFSELDCTGLYGKFVIINVYGNTFQAFYEGTGEYTHLIANESDESVIPPEQGGALTLHTATFCINGDNLLQAGSESNDNLNTLNEHYTNLDYWLSTWTSWSQVSQTAYYPYYITEVTTDEFYTHRQSSYGGPGGYCPFVSVWDGGSYVPDNNVLPRSVLSNESDVEDYYRLERTPVRDDGKYMLLLSEFASDHSYFDQVKLLAVDHNTDVNVAVTPSGEILTYMNPSEPVSATDNFGSSRLNEISFMDGDVSDPNTYFQGTPGDYLVLSFGQVNTKSAKLILRDDQKKMDDPCILVQVKNGSDAWQTVETLVPRAYWSIEAVDLSPYVIGGHNPWVRLYWGQPHGLDYVGLDTTPQANFDIRSGNLVSAIHSTQGNVKSQLSNSDNVYVELVPGQQIQLEFTLSDNSKEARTYILYTKGHYYTIP